MAEKKVPEKGVKASPKMIEKTAPKAEKVEKPAAKKIEKPKEAKPAPKKPKTVFTTGKRKRAVARAVLKPGSGLVRINTVLLENIQNEVLRLRMKEPLILAGDSWKSFDISVNVRGGGVFGQANAVRQAIAKGLIQFAPNLKQTFTDYDRNLLVYDPRRTEPHKPPRSSQGPRRRKQRSKR